MIGKVVGALFDFLGWQGVVGLVVAALLTVQLSMAKAETHRLAVANSDYHRIIHDPKDGLIRRIELWRDTSEWNLSQFNLSETRRSNERRDAVNASTAAAKFCDARVAVARRSAKAISAIVSKEPTRDSANCPIREPVAPDLVRDALGATRPH